MNHHLDFQIHNSLKTSCDTLKLGITHNVCAMVKRSLGLAGCTRTRAEWGLRPPERTPAVRNEQEHRSEARMPCELPGLAQRPFAGRALRSKAVARGGNPERRGPTMALVVGSLTRRRAQDGRGRLEIRSVFEFRLN